MVVRVRSIMEKVFYLVAGANGSGKTTLSKKLLPADNLVFLNADEIAKSINPDNIESVKISAGKEVFKRLQTILEKGKNFAMETTLSGKLHLKVIEQARKFGYKVVLIYAFLDNPELCINRIKVRVKSGGHNIPDEDVRRRYVRSKNNFWNLYKDEVDEWLLFYNGGDKYFEIAHGIVGNVDIFDKGLYDSFIKDIQDE